MSDRQKGLPGFSGEEMKSIVASLVDGKFVDDVRFASAYVRDKARFAGWGAVKISYNLKCLGIEPNIVNCVLDENMDLFGDSVLEKLLQKKWNDIKGDMPLQQKRAKVLRFALGRGFHYGQIMDIINSFR